MSYITNSDSAAKPILLDIASYLLLVIEKKSVALLIGW